MEGNSFKFLSASWKTVLPCRRRELSWTIWRCFVSTTGSHVTFFYFRRSNASSTVSISRHTICLPDVESGDDSGFMAYAFNVLSCIWLPKSLPLVTTIKHDTFKVSSVTTLKLESFWIDNLFVGRFSPTSLLPSVHPHHVLNSHSHPALVSSSGSKQDGSHETNHRYGR